MSKFRYYRLWGATASRHSISWADGIAFLLSVIGVPLVQHFVPSWETTMVALAWQIPSGAFASIILVRLILAPYWINKEKSAEAARISQERDSLKRKIEELEGTAADGSPLDFSVKIESIQYRYESILLDSGLDTQKRPPCLVAEISFRTNQAIQIASLHLEIDPIDPRDIIKPDSNLAQGFPLPHILHRAETHQFQFQLLPENVEGEHKLFLKVLAGGRWYTDGPYTLNEE